jgi:endonuclease/exonuclease/phosphatase family metal-dependent hydrolase
MLPEPEGQLLTAAPSLLRLITWNLRKLKGAGGTLVSAGELAGVIVPHHPHLVLCQEVFHSCETAGPAQSRDLATLLSMSPAYGPNAVYRRGNHGNAILTALPIERSANFDLSTNRIEKRGVLYARLEHPDFSLHVLNTHLGLNSVQRRRQVGRIAQVIEELVPDGEPLILAGDFNDWTGRLDRWVRERCRVNSAFEGLPIGRRLSWPSHHPVFGLDRVYLRHLVPLSVQVLGGAPFDRLSDHLPITVQLGLQDR